MINFKNKKAKKQMIFTKKIKYLGIFWHCLCVFYLGFTSILFLLCFCYIIDVLKIEIRLNTQVIMHFKKLNKKIDNSRERP